MWDRASADAGGAGIPHVAMTLTPGGPKFPSTAREQDAPSIQMMCFPSRPVTYSFNHFRLPGEICGLKVLEAIQAMPCNATNTCDERLDEMLNGHSEF